MIYPDNIEQKIGINEIRQLLKSKCFSSLGKSKVDEMAFSGDAETINTLLGQLREFRYIINSGKDFPLSFFFDVRESLMRIKLEGTYMEEDELFDLKRSLTTVGDIVKFLAMQNDEEEDNDNKTFLYPALHELSADVMTFPMIIRRIDNTIDKFGKVKDTASPELAQIRHELSRAEGSISRTLYSIMRMAQSEGLVEKDASPTIRDGRLVIPVAPGMKRKIKGIVHDESATGKTVFIEPEEVVEANNRIRELESEERKEIIRILTEIAKEIRPNANDMLESLDFLAKIDFIHAKAEVAEMMKAIEPKVERYPYIDWIRARHPLLEMSLAKQDKKIMPLDIMLTPKKHILIISGPNAGGKSVCLKTVGLLQFMLQCGLAIPVDGRSKVGVFSDIMMDIGDEQSIENDLSTYSSHLLNMKNMMKQASNKSLLLIDEFGTGTEPQIGGAIAEAVLTQFCNKGAYGVITTHYQNLKHFADSHDGVANGAMLYDRKEMQALFQLQIGQPGSSFAIEIARKIGLPEQVIKDASDIVGSDYIQSDKYLQDIVRDKRYWENKRQNIHQREKNLEKTISKYENSALTIEAERKEILRHAKEQAQELLNETNRKIENAIREIREAQAAKEETKRIRKELDDFKDEVSEIDAKANDDMIARKIEQIKQRKERHAKRLAEKAAKANQQPAEKNLEEELKKKSNDNAPIKEGDTVRIKGTKSTGKVESIDGKMATIIIGAMRTKTRLSRLEHAKAQAETSAPMTKNEELAQNISSYHVSVATQHTIDDRRKNFHQDLDVRGMRGDEALNAVTYFIDDAILVGMPRVRILHGKGNGILRQLIRQFLSGIPNVASYRDEHVQFGGAGITVVDIE